MQNLDAIITESKMHLITFKFDQNFNEKPDQQIKNQIKNRYNSRAIQAQSRYNLDVILQNLDAI